jgi:hypothetical protein
MRFLVAWTVLLLCAPAAAQTVAVLPLLTPEGEDAAGLAEATFRSVLTDELGWEVQERAVTAAEADAARSMGMDCAWDDAACLARVGIILRVQRLVSGNLSADGLLTFLLIDAETGAELARASAQNPDAVEKQAAVAAQLARDLAASQTESEPEPEPDPEPVPDDVEPTVEEPPPADEVPWLLVGGITAGAGAAVAALSLAGVLTLEGVMQLSDVGSYADRVGMQTGGRALAVVAVLGVVVGALGGSMTIMPLLEEDA